MEDASSQLHDSEGPLVSSPVDRHRKSNGYHSKHVSIKERLSHFTWSWFECTMSTGALATLLGQQPFTFNGLETIGKIFFLLNIILFVTFCGMITFRFIMHPSALASSLHHPMESFYFGTFWVSIALILYGMQEYGVPSVGPWLVRALEILFWAYAACALLVVVFQYHVIFDLEQLPVTHAMPAWLLPAYPFLVLGPLAAVLEGTQPARASTPILIGGIVFEGLGWSVAFIMYTVYFTRLINSQLPEPSKRPGMFVAVGPAGYTANTFAGLGLKAPAAVPANFLGNPTSVPTGEVWKMCAVPVAVFVWLLGFWFSSLATVSCIRGYREMHFTLNYWAFIFPNVGLTIGALQIANAFNSTAIKAVVSAATVVLVILWIIVAVLHVLAVWRGDILWPGKDEDMEDVEGHENDTEASDDKSNSMGHGSKGAQRREERRKRVKRRGGRRKQF